MIDESESSKARLTWLTKKVAKASAPCGVLRTAADGTGTGVAVAVGAGDRLGSVRGLSPPEQPAASSPKAMTHVTASRPLTPRTLGHIRQAPRPTCGRTR